MFRYVRETSALVRSPWSSLVRVERDHASRAVDVAQLRYAGLGRVAGQVGVPVARHVGDRGLDGIHSLISAARSRASASEGATTGPQAAMTCNLAGSRRRAAIRSSMSVRKVDGG
jgi:hypothetical protein